MKRFWIVLITLAVMAVPALYLGAQVQYSKTAQDRVERLLRDKSSTFSRSMKTRVGDYRSVQIKGTYPHIFWHRASVDGVLTVDQKRYWFMVIDRNGSLKIEAVIKL